jgi:deoxyribodipyrimidine photo-lyase
MADDKVLVWLHGGSLSSTDPALLENPNSPAIFVFDKPFLQSNKISFGRLQFMFEGVLEAMAARVAPVRVCVGVQADEILAFAKEQGCNQIHTTQIPSPELERTSDLLEQAGLEVLLHYPTRLTSFSGRVKRFSAFWKEVEREVLHG